MSRQSNTYYYFDRGILAPQGMSNAQIHVSHADKDMINNPMFTEGWLENPCLPWEVRYDNAYPNVIYDHKNDIYHCYYTLFTRDKGSSGISREERSKSVYKPTPDRRTSLCYACSKDGIHWIKPKLGLVEFDGNCNNNIMLLNAHGTGVFLDELELDPKKRYKLVTMVDYPNMKESYMAVGFSEDGIHWGKLIRWPKHKPPADSHNFPCRDPRDGKFKLITRVWDDGMRVSAVCESDDFINWSEPREIARGQGLSNQLYSMPVIFHNNLCLGFASMFHEGDRLEKNFDTVDLELYMGTSLRHMDPVSSGEHIIEHSKGKYPYGGFDCACIYAAQPIKIDDKFYIYYMGGNGQHTSFRETSLGRAFIDCDKLGYISPKDSEEYMIVPSTMMVFFGNKIELLYELQQKGEVYFSVRPRWNLPAFDGFDECDAILEESENGWKSLRFAKPFESINTGSATLVVRARSIKLYAIRGDLIVSNPRYFGGESAN